VHRASRRRSGPCAATPPGRSPRSTRSASGRPAGVGWWRCRPPIRRSSGHRATGGAGPGGTHPCGARGHRAADLPRGTPARGRHRPRRPVPVGRPPGGRAWRPAGWSRRAGAGTAGRRPTRWRSCGSRQPRRPGSGCCPTAGVTEQQVVTGPQGVQAGPLGVTRRSGDVTERVERRRRAQQHSPDPDLHSHPRTDDVTSPSQAARPTGTSPVTGSRQSPLSCRTVTIHQLRGVSPADRAVDPAGAIRGR